METKKSLAASYEDVRDHIMGILKSGSLVRKILLAAGLAATTISLVWLVIRAFLWIVVFLAGLVLLTAAWRGSSSSSS